MVTSATALLLIDAQQGLLDGETAIPDAAGVTSRLVKVLAAARSAGSLIVHLQNDGAPGTLDEPGTPGWSIHAQVAPAPDELFFAKRSDDGFDGTALVDVLARERVNSHRGSWSAVRDVCQRNGSRCPRAGVSKSSYSRCARHIPPGRYPRCRRRSRGRTCARR